jgi:hypothetical protein
MQIIWRYHWTKYTLCILLRKQRPPQKLDNSMWYDAEQELPYDSTVASSTAKQHTPHTVHDNKNIFWIMHVHTVTRIVVAPKLCRPRWNEGFGSHGNLRLSVFHNQKNSICVARMVEKSIILVYRMGKLNRQGVKMWGHLRKLMMMCWSPTIPDVSFAHEFTSASSQAETPIGSKNASVNPCKRELPGTCLSLEIPIHKAEMLSRRWRFVLLLSGTEIWAYTLKQQERR